MKPIIYLLFAAIIISGCKKNGGSGPQHHSVDVYISGTSVPDPDNEGATIASYWKNGVLTAVAPTGPVPHGTEGRGIAVKDTDVYLAGYNYDVAKKQIIAGYWENGAFNQLPDDGNGSSANCISISGQDIYIAGEVYGPGQTTATGVYWKNGQRHDIGAISPAAIVVKGSDIYVAGSAFYPGPAKAIFWKNGVATDLPPGNTYTYGAATGISVHGNDVYISGNVRSATGHSIATYWKNNVPVQLQPDTANSYATCILAVNSDVYIGFYIYPKSSYQTTAYYWKNGSLTKLTDNGAPSAIAVNNQDLYISGDLDGGSLRPTGVYWKNGVSTTLNAAYAVGYDWNAAYTTGIVVVNH